MKMKRAMIYCIVEPRQAT